eukprot:404907-Alexandrium_andersonii.AAC.1
MAQAHQLGNATYISKSKWSLAGCYMHALECAIHRQVQLQHQQACVGESTLVGHTFARPTYKGANFAINCA